MLDFHGAKKCDGDRGAWERTHRVALPGLDQATIIVDEPRRPTPPIAQIGPHRHLRRSASGRWLPPSVMTARPLATQLRRRHPLAALDRASTNEPRNHIHTANGVATVQTQRRQHPTLLLPGTHTHTPPHTHTMRGRCEPFGTALEGLPLPMRDRDPNLQPWSSQPPLARLPTRSGARCHCFSFMCNTN